MNWNFGAGFFSPHNLSRAGLVAGAGLGASALAQQDAEGAQLPGFQRGFLNRFVARDKTNFPVGNMEPEVFAQIQEKFPDAQNSVQAGTHAGFTRLIKSNWHPAKTASRMGEVLDSKDAAVVKNWQEKTGKGVHADYGILIPNQKDPTFVPFYLGKQNNIVFKTLFSPSKGQMKKAGYGKEGGLLPLISRSQEAPSTQRMPLSAVNPQPAHEEILATQSSGVKENAISAAIGTGIGAGLTLAPGEALGWGPGGLRTAELRPGEYGADRTGELHPSDIGGNITGDLRFSGALPSAENMNSFTAQAGDLVRQAGLGARGVLEGLGAGLTLGLSDPGRGLADLAGLPSPKNSTEQERVDLNRTFAELAGTGLLGAGLAKAPGAAVSSIGRGLSSDPVSDALLTLADKNFDSMLDYGNKIMDRMESYGLDLDDE